MIACICGYEAMTEDDLKSHFIECHRLSYGLEPSQQCRPAPPKLHGVYDLSIVPISYHAT